MPNIHDVIISRVHYSFFFLRIHLFFNMIILQLYCNMDNSNFDYVNVKYTI